MALLTRLKCTTGRTEKRMEIEKPMATVVMFGLP